MSRQFAIIPMHPPMMLTNDQLEAIVGAYLEALAQIGGERRTADTVTGEHLPVFLLAATGGSERVIMDWWARQKDSAADQPLWLIAHPGNNSLPAALEVLARLQQDGAQGRIFYLKGPDDQTGLKEITSALHDTEVQRALHRARIGLVGTPSDWLVASSPDASTVRSAWGPTVVPVEMDEVVKRLETISDAEIETDVENFVNGADEVREPTSSELHDVARLYHALKQVVADHRLDALTVRCFDFVLNQKTTGCFALAQLTDDGVIAGCEGDLLSTIGLLWTKLLLEETPWMANPAQLDPQNNTLWLAHCTVPRSLVSSYGLRSHFESGLGVGIQGTLPNGPVTLLRIGGHEMDRLWLAEGEILRSGNAENLCRTQAEIRLSKGGDVTDLLRTPLGNHMVLVSGHHHDRIERWCRSAADHIVMI